MTGKKIFGFTAQTWRVGWNVISLPWLCFFFFLQLDWGITRGLLVIPSCMLTIQWVFMPCQNSHCVHETFLTFKTVFSKGRNRFQLYRWWQRFRSKSGWRWQRSALVKCQAYIPVVVVLSAGVWNSFLLFSLVLWHSSSRSFLSISQMSSTPLGRYAFISLGFIYLVYFSTLLITPSAVLCREVRSSYFLLHPQKQPHCQSEDQPRWNGDWWRTLWSRNGLNVTRCF